MVLSKGKLNKKASGKTEEEERRQGKKQMNEKTDTYRNMTAQRLPDGLRQM